MDADDLEFLTRPNFVWRNLVHGLDDLMGTLERGINHMGVPSACQRGDLLLPNYDADAKS